MNPRIRKKHSSLPAIAQAGPVSLWMILFVTIPMLFIVFISFMTSNTRLRSIHIRPLPM